MASFNYVDILPARVRNDPLGPVTLNQLHVNDDALDQMYRLEHLANGEHNAWEVPWIVGHVVDGAPPTGGLFNTAYGGGTLSRPATGQYNLNAVAGVVGTNFLGNLAYAAMANVTLGIESKPRVAMVEAVSATSFNVRIRGLSSGLGAGNIWADVNADFDFGLHAQPKSYPASLLSSYGLHQRGDFLTEQATDWNALVGNQGVLYKSATLEHTTGGVHNVGRIAKAVGWINSVSGPSYSLVAGDGITSVTRISTGVVEVLCRNTMTSLSTMACFCEGQPNSAGEMVIVNGKGFATGAGTTKFRFYIYVFSGGSWNFGDRSFFASMFGV